MIVTLKEMKLEEIRDLCAQGANSRALSLQSLSNILGNLSWAVTRGAVRTVPLSMCSAGSEPCLEELQWWRDGVMTSAAKPLEELNPDNLFRCIK